MEINKFEKTNYISLIPKKELENFAEYIFGSKLRSWGIHTEINTNGHFNYTKFVVNFDSDCEYVFTYFDAKQTKGHVRYIFNIKEKWLELMKNKFGKEYEKLLNEYQNNKEKSF
ncbi:MAG: hypothetical protein E7376_05080 [Clostridiales bacterium]|nr:hypothetical protein [Clostridiales bacterium]